MAENVTPVTLEVKDFAKRQVLMVDYQFEQATDREGQIAGIPRGGHVHIRVKAMNDGNSELLQWMIAPNDPRDFKITFFNTVTLSGEVGRRTGALRRDGHRLPKARERLCTLRQSLGLSA